MGINLEDLNSFLEDGRVEFEDGPSDEVRSALEKIWDQNDKMGGKVAPGYIDKRRAARFLKSQGVVVGMATLTFWARQCGRFSWDKK